MHVHTTRRHYKDKVYETTLLRRSFREDGKVKNETIANLSHLPAETIALIRESLAGKHHVEAGTDCEIERALPHGHVAAVWAMAEKLGLASCWARPVKSAIWPLPWSWPEPCVPPQSSPPRAGGRRPPSLVTSR